MAAAYVSSLTILALVSCIVRLSAHAHTVLYLTAIAMYVYSVIPSAYSRLFSSCSSRSVSPILL